MKNDIVSYNAEDEGRPPDVAAINLFDRLHEAEHPPKKPDPVPAPEPIPAPVAVEGIPHEPGKSRRTPLIAGALLLVLASLGGGAYVLSSNSDDEPVAVASPTPSVRPSAKPSVKPSFAPRPTAKPPAPPPQPRPNSYTVQAGDTLITIGEKLNKDWRAIAAANGNISDPNLIHTGQVLIIP